MREGINKVSKSVRAYVYLVLTSEVEGRSVIVFNSASAVDVQQVFERHCVKSVQIRSFFWSVFSRIWTSKNSVFGHFSHSEHVLCTDK